MLDVNGWTEHGKEERGGTCEYWGGVRHHGDLMAGQVLTGEGKASFPNEYKSGLLQLCGTMIELTLAFANRVLRKG